MNVLWIIEGNKKSANYKIAFELAKNMKQKHTLSCAVYSGNEYEQCQELRTVFDNVSFIGSVDSKKLSDLYADKRWGAKTNNQKLKYALIHPQVAAELLRKEICKGKKRSIRQLKKICTDEKIDVIIGVVFPYKIANIMSEVQVNAKKLIIQLDPYVNNYTLNPKKITKRIAEEQRLLNSIQCIFTTGIIKNEMLNNHKIENNKIVEIEFPEMSVEKMDDEKEHKALISKNEDSIFVLYAGSLYKDIRNPVHLVRLFEQLPENYLLVVAGFNSGLLKEYDEKIRNRVIDLGYIDQTDVECLKKDADVLVCFNNAIENQVPSKLFECIETGKPFINLCQLVNCPSLPYVQEYDNVINVFINDMKPDEIIHFIETHKNKVIARDEILKKYYKHTYEYVVNQIEEVVTSVNI